MFIEENLIGKYILVEKPLFDSFDNLEINKNQVFVDYNLHFHPLLIKIKEKISEFFNQAFKKFIPVLSI